MKIKGKVLGKRCLSILLAVAVTFAGMMYLNISANAETVEIGTVTGNLNFRNGPGTEYEIVGYLSKGDSGTIIDRATATTGTVWYKMTIDGVTGWASSKYIEVTEQNVSSDAEFEAEIAAFPESYKAQLRALHEKYPNWKFEASYTGLDWENAVAAESKLGVNLVYATSKSSWKSTQTGAYDWTTSTWKGFDGSNWVAASTEIIQYYMDPRNFLDETYIFQFLEQSYDADTDYESSLTSMVKDAFLAGTFEEDGVTYTYVEAILEAAEYSNVSPYVIAAMIIQEQGVDGSGGSISGVEEGYEGFYNFFNVGAYATDTLTAVQKGLEYAKVENGSYGRPWNTRIKSISGGAEHFGSGYINAGQDTLYFKKFNVQKGASNTVYTHQYMTNIQGAASEGAILAKAYDSNARNSSLIFKIPVYNNMPSSACTKPTGDGSPNYMLKALSVTDCTLTPTFDMNETTYSAIVENSVSSVTVSATAYDSAATISGTETKSLNVGTNTIKVVVTAGNGDTRTYTINIVREEAENIVLEPTVSSSSYTINSSAKTITGISSFPVNATEFVKGFSVENGTVKVVKADESTQTGNVGTGNKINVFDSTGAVNDTYNVIIYGDVSGDGSVNALDLLRVQKQILGTTSLSGSYKIAADTSRNGTVDALDLLQVQKHIIGVKTINQ